MDTQKKITVVVDLKRNGFVQKPMFIQNDTNIIEFQVQENGEDADVSSLGEIITNYRRPDKEIISHVLSVEDGVIPYEIGTKEMEVAGEGDLEIQFYNGDSTERISTKQMKVKVLEEIGSEEIADEEEEETFLQEVLIAASEAKKDSAKPLAVETRTSDPSDLYDGRMWLRSDL
ncbi:BppU family phage baseplate upper protein [Alteribacillus sp. YIM 98480]|uniref:BppU family phage baseplate upper protein n=1 Tax=Alteribacillus sp. YIM 98480 TaxID=2606599 RepID=UPI00131C6610|nr:BppU family phage baseplate upper protein [Alteribacillus sp. YIM 98480]